MTTRPVLIVDDDIDHAVIARMVVADVVPGAVVETCMDPRAAVSRVQGAQVSAIILIDRLLDGVESIPLLRAVTAARPDLHVVVLSASLTSLDEERALLAGAHEAIQKPSSLAGWRALVEGVVGRATAVNVEPEQGSRAG